MPDKKDDVPKEESSEKELQHKKLLALSNDKLTYDNVMSHCKALMTQSEQIISDGLKFRAKLDDEYIESLRHHRDNDRKTLSYLYDVEIPEAVANAIIVKAAEIISAKNKK